MVSELPLGGVRVLDLSAQLPGPYASQLLLDLGARVVKVERPGTGDRARSLPPIFLGVNRGKRSIAIDLKDRRGTSLVCRLAERSDVVLEGFRPGVADRLGVGYAALSEVNAALVYCSISGFGQTGPYRARPGHDANYMAAAGALDPDDPRVAPLPIADLASGTFAALAVTAALYRARDTGKGAHVDLAMSDAILSWMATRMNPERMPAHGRDIASVVPCYGVFETSDGRHLVLGIAHEDHFWSRFCEAADLPEYAALSGPERIARREEIGARLKLLFSQRTLDAWLRHLPVDALPVTPVQTIEEVRADAHHRARGSLFTLDDVWQTRSPWPRGAEHPHPGPPEVGEHTRKILLEAGLDADAIDSLASAGVISEPAKS